MIWQRSVLPERLIGFFQGDMTEGALSAWGVKDFQPEWARVAEKEPTRATWTAMPRGVTVEAIGESLCSLERHPPLDTVRDGSFDGLLMLSIIEEDWIAQVLELGIPTVIVDFPNERFALQADQVYVDPLPGYRAAVRRLVEQGARKIHFVGLTIPVATPSPNMSIAEVKAFRGGKNRVDPDCYLRLNAYRQGMNECGLPEPPDGVHFFTRIEQLATKLIGLPEDQRPEAVVAHNITEAEALMRAFADRGLSLKGTGASPGGYGGPALAVRADGRELGRTAAELLVWRLQKPDRSVLRVGVPMVLQARPTSDQPEAPRPVSMRNDRT
jgi:DNA-binding LacI/PurR family transcriptional regulator